MLGETDLIQLKENFGSSHEFIKSLTQNYTSYLVSGRNALLEEPHLLASCKYETGTKWGQEVPELPVSLIQLLHQNSWRQNVNVYSLNCCRLVSHMIV